ncbi:MAG: ribonuclease P protein component [Clostridia bacterium]|nr:ribonuclease P protein component [Clostridia bacterium]
MKLNKKEMGFVMKKTLPITRNSLFRRLYSKGKSGGNFDMVVYVMPVKSTVNRLGLTVSTKVGNAVVRNRIRRRLREAYRSIENNIPNGINMVIVARSSAKDRRSPELKASLVKILKKLDVWVDAE